jgi:hypothetical protein
MRANDQRRLCGNANAYQPSDKEVYALEQAYIELILGFLGNEKPRQCSLHLLF